MNQYWEQLEQWQAEHYILVVLPRRNVTRKSLFLSDECPAGRLSTSAAFAMAYIVVAVMRDMLAQPVCSSCNTIVLLCIRFWTALVASVVRVVGHQFYGQSHEVC